MSNTNSAQSWANRTKAAVSSAPTKKLTKITGGGSLEPINTYYQYGPVKDGAPPAAVQLLAGNEVLGTYEGTFTTKKFGTQFFKVRTSNGLVAVPGAGQLTKIMAKVPQGAEVQIVYKGKAKIEKGDFAGKMSHSFDISASEVI